MIAARTGAFVRDQSDALMMALGHGATHWVIATVYVVLPFLGKDLGLSYVEIGGLISIFHGSSFLANAGSGAVVDITGRYLTAACLALVLGAAALFAVGIAPGLIWLSAAIVVIGVTNNLWHPAAISLLSQAYPKARGFALSIHTLGATMGDILAPLAAGALMLALTWNQTAMVAAVPVVLVAIVLALVGVTAQAGAGEAESRKTADEGSYLDGLKALAADRGIVLLCVMAGFRSMTQNGLLLFLPLYLVNELGSGPLMVGIAMTGIQAGAIVSGPVAGALSDRIGRRPVVFAGLAATSLLIAAMNATSEAELFIALACLLGCVMFAVRPVIHGWSLDLAPERMSGTVISLLFGTQSAFTFIVPLAGGWIADTYGLSATFYMLTVTIVIAAGLSLLVPQADAARQRVA